MGYTFDQLRNEGPAFAFEMLLQALEGGEPYITYGRVGDTLRHQLGIDRLFTVHVGQVAGSMMNQILAEDPNAPLINVLITNARGIPGAGGGNYLDRRQRVRARRRPWSGLSSSEKLAIVERERRRVLDYPHWETIGRKLFGDVAKGRITTVPETEAEVDVGGDYGGEPESPAHRRLKLWAARNPVALGLARDFGLGAPEARLLSGDKVDVLFRRVNEFVLVEVKSRRSSDADLHRGLYQCVKYRAVKHAEQQPYAAEVRSILVTERDLPQDLKVRAKLLGVPWINVKNR